MNLQAGGSGFVLVGRTQFADKLSSPSLAQLRQRISILCRLEPLAREEIVRYIGHRLQVAGHVGAPLFTGEALQKIAAHSEGIPRNINNLCFNSLLLGYAAGWKQVDSSIIAQVLENLEMNPREPKCVVTQQELQKLPQPPVSVDQGMFNCNYPREIGVEFETPPNPVPQTPQAQVPPQLQRAQASPPDVAPEDFSHSKVDSENGHKRVSHFGTDPPARKASVTRSLMSPPAVQADPCTTRGKLLGGKQNPSRRGGITYLEVSREGLGRRVWGISILAAAVLLAGLFVFRSGVRVGWRSQGPPSAAAAPALTPQPTPEVSNRSVTPSTFATSPLASDAPLNQSFLTPTIEPKIERIVSDPGHGGEDAGASGSTTRVADTNDDTNTEFTLGVRYALDAGVLRNDSQAFSLFKKAPSREMFQLNQSWLRRIGLALASRKTTSRHTRGQQSHTSAVILPVVNY